MDKRIPFDQWRKEVMSAFKKRAFMVPGNDWLFSQWEQGKEPIETIREIRERYARMTSTLE